MVYSLILPLLLATSPPQEQALGPMLYFMREGDLKQAIDAYEHLKQQNPHLPIEPLHEMSWSIMKDGLDSQDPHIALLSLLGASLTTQDEAIPLFLKALSSSNPSIQHAALTFLAQSDHDLVHNILPKNLASNSLLMRLEALLLMAKKRMPDTAMQAEALMNKIPSQLHVVFPQIFAYIGDPPSLKLLRRFLSSPIDSVKISAIHSVKQAQLYTFLPQIRRLAKLPHPLIQEAALACLTALEDEQSQDLYLQLSSHQDPHVQLAAIQALLKQHHRQGVKKLSEVLEDKNPYTVQLLGLDPTFEPQLLSLSTHPDPLVRTNATIALVQAKNPKSIPPLMQYLLYDSLHTSVIPHHSPGKALTLYKPSHPQEPFPPLHLKDSLLIQAAQIGESHFLPLAQTLLKQGEKTTLPTLLHLLENFGSEQAIALCQTHSQKVGHPFIRSYCTITLYKLAPTPQLQQQLIDMLRSWNQNQHLAFASLLNPSPLTPQSPHELTSQEISQLFLAALEALVSTQDPQAIDLLLELMRDGAAENRYALAGLLIRATL